MPDDFVVRRLTAEDTEQFAGMLDLFADAFDDPENYTSARPSPSYQRSVLTRDDIVVLAVLADTKVVGALVAYELMKFEQERSEFYIYDIAVDEDWRRRGVATSIISVLNEIAQDSDASAVFVQADYGDDPAIALYTKLGQREDVMHFDIDLPQK